MATQQAYGAEAFVQTIGVNTHLDFGGSGYTNLAVTEAAIRYLGVNNLRDSPGGPQDLQLWQQVARDTGVKFDAFIGETSPGGMSTQLGYLQQIAQTGIVNYVEGGNEEDDDYPLSLGNNQYIAAQFQQQVFNTAKSFGLPAINISFGAGWTAANNWQGNYGTVGDLSGITDYANAHTYPSGAPDITIQQLNADAHLAAASRPVITTEFGYDITRTDMTQAAKWSLGAVFDGIKNGDLKTYFYALYDDPSGYWGLVNMDGSPRPTGQALHNLTSLLHDDGSFTPGSLDYTFNNTAAGDNSLLLQKSDRSFWLALWNESNGGHSVTVNLGSTANAVDVYDPLTGTNSTQSFGSTNSAQVWVPDHPVLVRIASSGAPPVSDPAPSPTPAPSPSPSPSPPTGGGSPPTSTGGMTFNAPSNVQATPGQPVLIPNLSLTDPYASSNGTPLTVKIADANGSLATYDAWGNLQQGNNLTLSGNIWQVNAGLSNLHSSGTNDTLQLTAQDQAGNQASTSITIGSGSSQTDTAGQTTTGGQTTPNTPTTDPQPTQPTPPPTQPTQPAGNGTNIAANDSSPVITASSTTITATAGDHMFFIDGTGDTLNATGGTERVQAFQGGNTIVTGAGNDTIQYAGSGNTIDAGAGNNHLEDSGSNNIIVLPGGGQGNDDIYGWVMQNGDKFDLRPLLKQAGWDGNAATIGNIVHVNMSGNDAVINVSSGGGSFDVATLRAAGPTNLQTLLAHSITS